MQPDTQLRSVPSKLCTKTISTALLLACIGSINPTAAITPDESGRHLSEYYPLTFAQDSSPLLIPLRLTPPDLPTLLRAGSTKPPRITKHGTLLYDLPAADALRITGGYWSNNELEPFALIYRDRPRNFELDTQKIPAPIKDALAKAYRFEYGTEIPADNNTLVAKLTRIQERYPLAPFSSILTHLNSSSTKYNSWLNRTRGAATVSAHAHKLPTLPAAYLCDSDVILSDVEVVDLLAAAYSENKPAIIHGENRGTHLDRSIPSPERYLFEELFGVRSLTPETFIDLLTESIRPDGAGLILDEASDPRSKERPHFEVWERPVHDFLITENYYSTPVTELPYDLVVRYWEAMAAVYADAALLEKLQEGYTLSEQALKEVDRAYKAYVQAPIEVKNQKLALYKEAKRNYRDTFHDKFLSLASTLWKLAQESLDARPWQVTLTTIQVKVQRERADIYSLKQPLTTLEYSALSLKHFVHRGEMTWLQRTRHYPPDYAYVPTLDSEATEAGKEVLGYLQGERCEGVGG